MWRGACVRNELTEPKHTSLVVVQRSHAGWGGASPPVYHPHSDMQLTGSKAEAKYSSAGVV
jgi:hypothetical protein